MNFIAARQPVYNRGKAPIAFLEEMILWAVKAPDAFFERNEFADIYARVKIELGPFEDLLHRKAVMLEVLRGLALFESGCNWSEGVDASRRGPNTDENREAGAWQQSFNVRKLSLEIQTVLSNADIFDGHKFQDAMKANHPLAMTVATLALRIDMTDFHLIANGPVRKGAERSKTWPDRPKLWSPEESIYPWLNRQAVAEFRIALATIAK